jgi:hypothetical protein
MNDHKVKEQGHERDTQQQQTTRNNPPSMTRYETLQIVLTAFLLAAAIIGACIYGAQLSEMQKATVAATDAAKAARDSVTLASENTRRDQRPWLTLTTVNLVKPLTATEPPLVAVTIENSGRTPALDVTVHARVFARSDFAEEHLMTEAEGKVRSRAIIGPGTTTGSLFGGGTKTLGEEHVAAIAADKSRLYISGFVKYRDVFDCWHQTTFCFWISGNVTLERLMMVPCDIGNTAD